MSHSLYPLPDYFLWAAFKSLVLQRSPPRPWNTKEQHQRRKNGNITVDMLEKVAQSFRNRLHQCIDNEGGDI
ncbi:hypothetical protein TNCV_2091991 [Trichonephila clavipes]|nr:hypothetical protein TNCV_2091991 [Trichonephila clavipes]